MASGSSSESHVQNTVTSLGTWEPSCSLGQTGCLGYSPVSLELCAACSRQRHHLLSTPRLSAPSVVSVSMERKQPGCLPHSLGEAEAPGSQTALCVGGAGLWLPLPGWGVDESVLSCAGAARTARPGLPPEQDVPRGSPSWETSSGAPLGNHRVALGLLSCRGQCAAGLGPAGRGGNVHSAHASPAIPPAMLTHTLPRLPAGHRHSACPRATGRRGAGGLWK